MIRKLSITIVAILFLLVFIMSSSASALTISTIEINPESKEGYFVDGTLKPQQSEIEAAFGLGSGTLDYLLYKAEAGDGEEQLGDPGYPFYEAYSTTFDPPSDPTSATITWNRGDYISGDPIYLFVKDGKHGNYLFNLSNLFKKVLIDGNDQNSHYSWDGKDTLKLTGFWEGTQGAISHVSLWGKSTPVPEPGMMILLGIGLLGLALFGRKRLVN